MNTVPVLNPKKDRGRLRLLPLDLEAELADRYFGLNGQTATPATDLAAEFAPRTRSKRLSESGVREIAHRALRERENEKAPPLTQTGH